MILCILILLVAVYMDRTTGKINNQLILFGLLSGFLIRLCSWSVAGISYFFFGAFVPIILLFMIYRLGALGAGDVKLYAVVGGFCGPTFIWRILVASILLGGIYSLFLLLKNRNLRATATHFMMQMNSICQSKGAVRYQAQSSNRIHFSIFILLGTIICLGVTI